MNRPFRRLNIIKKASAMAAAAAIALVSFLTNAASWKVYPSFDTGIVSVIDSPEQTYFFVKQHFLEKGYATVSRPRTTIFRFDRRKPDAGISDMSQTLLKGSSPVLVSYNPAGRYLLAVYDDGRMQTIYDDGSATLHTSSSLTRPGALNFHNLTFSGQEALISTDAGILRVNPTDYSTDCFISTPVAIMSAALCGDRIAATDGAGLFMIPAGVPDFPINLPDLAVSDISGNAPLEYSGTIHALLPLAGSSFAMIAGGESEQGLYIVTIGADKAVGRLQQTVSLRLSNQIQHPTEPVESTLTPNRDGYLLVSGFTPCQLLRSATAQSAPEETTVTYGAPYVTNPVMGSWDCSSFWRYCDRGSFLQGSVTDGYLSWQPETEAVRPNVAPLLIAGEMRYSPEFGVTAITNEVSWRFLNQRQSFPVQISSLKEGVWTNYAPAYNVPRSTETDPALSSLYWTYRNYSFPTANPFGLAFDPLHPGYVFTGSRFHGMFAFNIADPTGRFLHMSHPKDQFAAFPGHSSVVATSERDSYLCIFSNVDFDGDNNAWSIFFNFDNAGNQSGDVLQLMCWTPQARAAAMAEGSQAEPSGWKTIGLHTDGPCSAYSRLCALKHPKNRNLLVAGTSQNHLCIINHKGTLDDSSDDEFISVRAIMTENGVRYDTREYWVIKEDPASGEVWVSSNGEIFSFSPTDKASNGVIPGRILDMEEGTRNPLSSMAVNDIAFDSFGRMWIATATNGIWCISADRRRVEHHFTAENSDLPSDNTYAVCWNPASGSLVISSDGGFAEVYPEAPLFRDSAGESAPYVFPRVIRPEHTSGLTVSNLPARARISVTDHRGNRIARLSASQEGHLTWNLHLDDNTRIRSGAYILRSDSGAFPDIEIIVI